MFQVIFVSDFEAEFVDFGKSQFTTLVTHVTSSDYDKPLADDSIV